MLSLLQFSDQSIGHFVKSCSWRACLRFQASRGPCEMGPKYDYCCCVGPWRSFLQKAVSLQSPTDSPKLQHINLHLILVYSLFPWRLFSVTMPCPRLNSPPRWNKHRCLQSPTMGIKLTAPHTSPRDVLSPLQMKKRSTQGDNRNTLSVPTACFLSTAFSEKLLYAKHIWFFLVKQKPPMDAEKFLGLYVYNECASMLPSCFYKANVSIHRTQIHEDNCAQRSNLVARPTFYRYGKPRAYKTVKHRDKSEERIQEEVCLEETRLALQV